MSTDEAIVKTPWDARCFGMDTYEIKQVSDGVFRTALQKPGHYTVKVEPRVSKKILHEYGFYYCDTLLEPYCTKQNFIPYDHKEITVTPDVAIDDAVSISHGAFSFGRFHRDFNISRELADLRYDNWLRQLWEQKNVLGLMLNTTLAGFFAFSANRIVLHALDQPFKGKGLSKFFWSAACRTMFEKGHEELLCSISAANVAVLNLYISLGFKFKRPMDVYHRLVP